MIKAVFLSLGFIFLLAPVVGLSAQNNATDMAVNEGVVRQANTIVLRQKLSDARNVANRGDLAGAAKLYQEAETLAEQIGSGINIERAQAVSGLATTRLALARRAQSQGDYHEADIQVIQVLKVDPKNSSAIAFKNQNDQLIVAMRGRMPDPATLDRIPSVLKDKSDAATLVQDGKLLYEMGKLEEAEAKLVAAMKLDPDNTGAIYYLNLVKQMRYARSESMHSVANADRMVEVQQAWDKPRSGANLSSANPYATTNLIYTGPGRQAIVSKLDRIRLDNVMYDGLPLSEVIRNLSEQSRLRDPEKRGINFLINPNADTSGAAAPAFPGAPGGTTAIDPATGLPAAPVPTGNAGGGETVEVGTVVIKINPALSDVRLADVLDAIVQVADHPIKYTVQDYAIVFSSKGPESPQLSFRTFKVDPNTFYQGLESVSSQSFGSGNSSSGGGGGGGGGGRGGGGGNSGGGGGGNSGGNNNSGALVPVVIAAPGGGGGGGGGNRGGQVGGAQGQGGGGLGNTGGGLRFVTSPLSTSDVSVAVKAFFTALGVDLSSPTKAVFFNDRLGLLFVKATEQDLDTIERAIQVLNQVAPQIHIKARFIDVSQQDDKALGFDWYLGNFINGKVIANGGSAPSLNVPTSPANPLGIFPGNTLASQVAGSATDQLITGGLRDQLGAPALATVTGILTDPNFRVVLKALEQRSGVEQLAEPEVTTTSGRQTQMKATQIITIVTDFNFQGNAGGGGTTTGGTTQ